MFKTLRNQIADLFDREKTPLATTELSSLAQVAEQFPHLYDFVERRYGIKIEPSDKHLSLKAFVERNGLPPAQIFFMEVQMSHRASGVHRVSARQAKELMENESGTALLDVREPWETHIAQIPASQALSPELLDQILQQWDKDTPIVVYCHFGVRSLDAATFLADRGFKRIYTIQGGIDAWSQDVDPSLKRYDQSYC